MAVAAQLQCGKGSLWVAAPGVWRVAAAEVAAAGRQHVPLQPLLHADAAALQKHAALPGLSTPQNLQGVGWVGKCVKWCVRMMGDANTAASY